MQHSTSSTRWLILLVLGAAFSTLGIVLLNAPYNLHKKHYKHSGGALQLGFTLHNARTLLQRWQKPIPGSKENGLTLNQKILFPGDTLLPLGYGLFFMSLLMLLLVNTEPQWHHRNLGLRWLPIAAMFCDFAENMLMRYMFSLGLDGKIEQLSAWVPMCTSLLAVIKYTLISILTPAFGYLLLIHRWKKQTKSLTMSLLIGLALLSPAVFLVLTVLDAVKFMMG